MTHTHTTRRHLAKAASNGMMKNRPGFTVLELLSVIAIIGALAAVSMPTLAAMKKTSDQKDSVDQIVSVLRQAQAQAIAGQGNADQVVTFSGTSTCTVTTPVLGTITASKGISCTNVAVTFKKLYGTATFSSGTGTIIVGTKSVTISSPVGVITST